MSNHPYEPDPQDPKRRQRCPLCGRPKDEVEAMESKHMTNRKETFIWMAFGILFIVFLIMVLVKIGTKWF